MVRRAVREVVVGQRSAGGGSTTRVFVTVAHYPGYGDDVEALSLARGEVLWGPVSIGGTYWTGRIAYDDGRVLAQSTTRSADRARRGQRVQSHGPRGLGRAVRFRPTAVAARLRGGAGTGGIYAVDEATRTTTWTSSVMNGEQQLTGGRRADGVYVSSACEQAYRFDLAGALVWRRTNQLRGRQRGDTGAS